MAYNASFRASLGSRLLPVPGILLSTILSVLLLSTALTNWTTSGSLYHFTVTSRASVQIVVHIVSWLLGTAQVFTIYTVSRARLNLRLIKTPIALDNLKFWISVSGRGYDPSLPGNLMFWSVLCFVVFSIPSLLWAGATTPVITTTNDSVVHISVARYTERTAHVWNLTCDWCWASGAKGPGESHTDEGVFGDQPDFGTQGVFLTQAASATSRNATLQTHAKIDNTGYIYFGRSYGIGGSVGLDSSSTVHRFEYYETGYMSRVECITNDTSPPFLKLLYNGSDYNMSTFPSVWQPIGYLPNDDEVQWADLTAISLSGSYSVFSILGSSKADRYIWKFVPGSGYLMFQNMQCELFFTPTQFHVEVDVLEKLITVTPQTEAADYDIDTTGAIKTQAFQQPWVFAAIDSVQLTSLVGNAFFNNIQNVAVQENYTNLLNLEVTGGNTTDAIRYRGVSEAFESVIDNSLLTFAMTQIMVANDTETILATATVPAVRFGQNAYIFILFATNILTVLIFLVELRCTRCWNDLPSFNITSTKSAIIAASAGGTGIAGAAAHWDGDDGDRRAGKVRVKIREGREGYSLILVPVVGEVSSSVWQRPFSRPWGKSKMLQGDERYLLQ